MKSEIDHVDCICMVYNALSNLVNCVVIQFLASFGRQTEPVFQFHAHLQLPTQNLILSHFSLLLADFFRLSVYFFFPIDIY